MVTGSMELPTGIPEVAALLAGLEGLKFTAPLSEHDYINYALAFASTDDVGTLYQVSFELTTGVKLEDFVYFPGLHDDLKPALLRARDRFVERLEIIRDSGKRAHIALAEDIWSAGQRIVIQPTFLASKDGVEVYYRHLPADFEAALGYVLLLFLDKSKSYGRDLCRCRLPTCQRFFLAIKPRTGRPRRDYCSEQHLVASRALTGVARVQRYRERKKEEAAKKQKTRRRAK